MLGLRDNFGLSLALTAMTVIVSFGVAAGVARRCHIVGRPWMPEVARVLAGGAMIAVIVATAMPRRVGIETDGDLVLHLGRAGLGEWWRFLDDPRSLASIQLGANVLLYAAVGFTMYVGWYHLRRRVLPACLALSVLIETVQFLVLGRVAALDDVLLNLAGAALGYLLAAAVARHRLSSWAVAGEPPPPPRRDRKSSGPLDGTPIAEVVTDGRI